MLARPGGQERVAGLDGLLEQPVRPAGDDGLAAAQPEHGGRLLQRRRTRSCGTRWSRFRSSPSRRPWSGAGRSAGSTPMPRSTASSGSPSCGRSGHRSRPATRRRRCRGSRGVTAGAVRPPQVVAGGARAQEGADGHALRSPDAAFQLQRPSEWRNRQTRQLEGLVPARAWGFKSPLRHHVMCQDIGDNVSGGHRRHSGHSMGWARVRSCVVNREGKDEPVALVEDPDLFACDQQDDVGPLVGPTHSDVVEAPDVAQRHLSRVVDLVVAHPVPLDVDRLARAWPWCVPQYAANRIISR